VVQAKVKRGAFQKRLSRVALLRGFYRMEPVVVMSGGAKLRASDKGREAAVADVTLAACAIR
jgi:hypothetical protein